MKKYYKGISILEIEPKRSDIEIIDIRRPLEIKIFSLEGIRAIPMGELLSSPGKYLKKDVGDCPIWGTNNDDRLLKENGV